MREAFLLCRDCRVLHPVFVPHQNGSRGVVDEETAIAYGQFVAEHRLHTLERVERCSLREYHDGRVFDPMRTSLIEVSNGKGPLTICRSRDDVELPRVWEVADQHIEERPSSLSIEEPVIRRALDRHFYPYVLRPSKIDDFVRAVYEVLATIVAEDVETAFNDGEDPAVSIARLPDDSCLALLTRCGYIFDAWELVQIASFVGANRDEYGALALRVRRESELHVS
jgi:hypothetical protein